MTLPSILLCLSLTVFYEARGEPFDGKVAVAHVVINRSKSSGSGVCREVFKRGQFSWTRGVRRKPKGDDWESAKKAAQDALRSKDTIQGATFFFNPNRCKTPKSIVTGRKKVKTIGSHVFFTDISTGRP